MLDEIKMLCPYCSTEFTAEMLFDFYYSSGCDTCGFGEKKELTIEIYCSKCGKLVYKKFHNHI